RLACQIRPKGNLTCEPLLPPDINAKEALTAGQYMHGQEMNITVMFADLRGFTKLSEKKLPFDVVFILNQYFQSMGTAIEGAGGRDDKFIGDGIMASFGAAHVSSSY
ncbi:MAG: adenylate/guanylate cyclase domain-containing protein, partial [Alphaproteobacteria bacterium]